MGKTKLGVSVLCLTVAMYLAGLFAGSIAMLLLAGYILLREDDLGLKKAAVRTVTVYFGFALLSQLVGLIPGVLDFLQDCAILFEGSFDHYKVDRVFYVLQDVLGLAETVVFLMLIFCAARQKAITVPVVDRYVETHMA